MVLYACSAATILNDLTSNQPTWLLPSYDPAKAEPLLLLDIDELSEELLVKFTHALKAGNTNDFVRALAGRSRGYAHK